jgi:hypothetical protein
MMKIKIQVTEFHLKIDQTANPCFVFKAKHFLFISVSVATANLCMYKLIKVPLLAQS